MQLSFTIYRCVKSPYVSQRFGENKACVQFGTSVLKGKTGDVCPAGYQDFYKSMGMLGHNGIDRPCIYREPVYFDVLDSDTEWDLYAEIDSAGGLGADAVSRKPILECTEGCAPGTMHHVKRRAWHNDTVRADIPAAGDDDELSPKELYLALVASGKERLKLRASIKPGELIAYADSTGASSGNHVHDGTKWSNPDGSGIHQDNGYYGAFDDSRFRRDIFILDELAERKREEIVMAENYGNFTEADRLRKEIIKRQLTLLGILREWLLALQQTLRKVVKH